MLGALLKMQRQDPKLTVADAIFKELDEAGEGLIDPNSLAVFLLLSGEAPSHVHGIMSKLDTDSWVNGKVPLENWRAGWLAATEARERSCAAALSSRFWSEMGITRPPPRRRDAVEGGSRRSSRRGSLIGTPEPSRRGLLRGAPELRRGSGGNITPHAPRRSLGGAEAAAGEMQLLDGEVRLFGSPLKDSASLLQGSGAAAAGGLRGSFGQEPPLHAPCSPLLPQGLLPPRPAGAGRMRRAPSLPRSALCAPEWLSAHSAPIR